ncbi:hypothetical protein ACP70R_043101 [Stipagrostis hirtigluma subsp. patula]
MARHGHRGSALAVARPPSRLASAPATTARPPTATARNRAAATPRICGPPPPLASVARRRDSSLPTVARLSACRQPSSASATHDRSSPRPSSSPERRLGHETSGQRNRSAQGRRKLTCGTHSQG